MVSELVKHNIVNNEGLQLSKLTLPDAYCEKWQVNCSDFVCITKNGELLRNAIYRVGGLNNPQIGIDKYFLLLKYVEAHYSKEILKMSGSKNSRHLEGRWCIFDKDANEIREFPAYTHPYLVKDSCLYSIDNSYYNIITNEKYGKYTSKSMESSEYLFLENKFDDDLSKRGIMKINKQTGTYEIFK